ncbi:zinc-binding metallopeptidase family protein [Foetidibacter luteolus]|uniref:zinc-binding metallopeptidase family protein n=1 Tax=Foetidibacter luteolus TaxID=2608880 RepID=UPI00129A410D|nr:putative zinc-binding peptidase [Foetidibacter luteolus]
MKLFKCQKCGETVYFENTFCGNCQSSLGFVAETLQLVSLTVEKNGALRPVDRSYKTTYRYCANHQHAVCNWLVPADSESVFCKACDLNRTIPALTQPEYAQRWATIESAKHRLAYALLRMKLPLNNKIKEPETGLAFDFVADELTDDNEKVLTGHDNGLITINIAEADDIEREMARKSMDEVYRTVLGHFRHEIGHYYWDRLVSTNPATLQKFRNLFGDEQQDYAEALNRHYSQGPVPDWSLRFISAYASAHPWEDWAESWAHYMHIVDTVETAFAFGINIETKISARFSSNIKTDPYEIKDFSKIISFWLPVTLAMNSLNRSMGLHDIYPFVLSNAAIEKLKFIHELVMARRK